MRGMRRMLRFTAIISGPLRTFRRFVRAKSGATAIEFAIVALPFFALLGGIFETSFVYFANQGLQAAVDQAARTVMTGQVQSNTAITSASEFRNQMICSPSSPLQNLLPSFITCSQIIVDVRPAGSLANFGSGDTSLDFLSSNEYCTGGPGDVVIVRAAYPMPVIFNLFGATASTSSYWNYSWNGGMVHMLEAVSAFRNEPFPGYTGAMSGC